MCRRENECAVDSRRIHYLVGGIAHLVCWIDVLTGWTDHIFRLACSYTNINASLIENAIALDYPFAGAMKDLVHVRRSTGKVRCSRLG